MIAVDCPGRDSRLQPPVMVLRLIIEMCLNIHKSAVINPPSSTCRLSKQISSLLMEIERGWWALAQDWNKWGRPSDRLGALPFLALDVHPLWGKDVPVEMALCKRAWFRGSCSQPLSLLETMALMFYVSNSEILLRTKSNDLKASLQLLAHPCLPTVIGK